MMAATVLLDGAQRVDQAVDAKANGMRKIRVKNEEFQNAVVGKVGGIHLAVAFKGGTRAQQPDPFQVIEGVVSLVRRLETVAVVDLEQPRRRRGALNIAADLNELPAFAMAQCRIGDTVE